MSVIRGPLQILSLPALRLFAVVLIDPGKSGLYDLLVHAFAIQVNQPNSSAISVCISGFHLDRFPENPAGGELLGSLAEVLVFFGRVNAVQADLFASPIVHDLYGITIGDADDLSLPGVQWGSKKQQERNEQKRNALGLQYISPAIPPS
jgi:hypothetical protein